jgi:CheY-specific phosphatase CheX
MFNHIFVSYLERKGVLTQQQTIDVLEIQKNTKIRIGTLAVEENLITPEQADLLNRQQSQQNKRFGELAIESGYLTADQLELLLSKQPRDHLVLKQILADNNYMLNDKTEAALVDFMNELGLDQRDFELLLDNDVDTYVSRIANISAEEHPLLSKFAVLFVSTVIRLVDKEVMLDKVVNTVVDTAPYAASVGVTGDMPCKLVLSAIKSSNEIDFAEKFMEGVMGAHMDATDEIAESAMKEFMNCVGGMMVTELTEKDSVAADLEVPEFFEKSSVGRELPVLPLSILNGDELKIFIM